MQEQSSQVSPSAAQQAGGEQMAQAQVMIPAATAAVPATPATKEAEVAAVARFLGRGLVDALVALLVVALLGLLLYLVVAAISFNVPLAKDWIEQLSKQLAFPLIGVLLYAAGLITKRPTWAGGE